MLEGGVLKTTFCIERDEVTEEKGKLHYDDDDVKD